MEWAAERASREESPGPGFESRRDKSRQGIPSLVRDRSGTAVPSRAQAFESPPWRGFGCVVSTARRPPPERETAVRLGPHPRRHGGRVRPNAAGLRPVTPGSSAVQIRPVALKVSAGHYMYTYREVLLSLPQLFRTEPISGPATSLEGLKMGSRRPGKGLATGNSRQFGALSA